MNPSQQALHWLIQSMTRAGDAAAGPLTLAKAVALQREALARQYGFVLPPTLEERVARLFGGAS